MLTQKKVLYQEKNQNRNYPLSFKNRYNLEIKISSIEGRFKDAQEINLEIKNKYTKYGIFDDQYGLTFPACIVNYYREYFYKDEIRLLMTVQLNIIIIINLFHSKKIEK